MYSLQWILSCCLDVRIISSLLLLFLVLIYVQCRYRHVYLNPEGRAVLVTGCDSGFGNLLARRLQHLGFTVFATCLFPDGEGVQTLIQDSTPGLLKVIKLNVTSDKEMAEAKEYVKKHLPEKGLWGIVNNAGISMWGNCEWHSMEQYQKIVDINLLGSIRTTLAFAPLLRKSKGRMVFLSSTNAYMTFINGIYAMTKAGIERFCDSLRLEMKQFGVLVSIIEPGNYARATGIQALRSADDVWNGLSKEMQEVYDKEYVNKLTAFVNQKLSQGSSKGYEVVDSIVDALLSPKPKPRYLVADLKEKMFVYFCCISPTSLIDLLFSIIN